jgi:hypothetical protein
MLAGTDMSGPLRTGEMRSTEDMWMKMSLPILKTIHVEVDVLEFLYSRATSLELLRYSEK